TDVWALSTLSRQQPDRWRPTRLTKNFAGQRAVLLLLPSCMLAPSQATIIPACLIGAHSGCSIPLSLPLLSTTRCISLFTARSRSVVVPAQVPVISGPPLTHAAGLPGAVRRGWRKVVASSAWLWSRAARGAK